MEPNVVGIHPPPAFEARRTKCGSFSFRGTRKPLYFIWTQEGYPIQTAAYIRSIVEGSAIITFHPCVLENYDDVAQFLVLRQVAFAAVPGPQEFSVHFLQGGQWIEMLPIGRTYTLPFGVGYRFRVGGADWEEWGVQIQMHRTSLTADVGDHNV
jgi:hypothetical protein